MYRAMPFGARHSPRIFTRALGYGLAYVRTHWQVRIIAYMDDILLLHQDRAYLELATAQIALYLGQLGWTINLEKSEFTPRQVIDFLGWRWSFDTLSIRMTPNMRKTILFLVSQWIRKASRGERVPCRRLGSLVGSLNFLRCQIPRATLYLRTLHTALATAVNSSGWDGYCIPPRRIISELQFWWRNASFNTPYVFQLRVPQATLLTDASKTKWGAVMLIGDQSLHTFGFFSTEYASDDCSSNRRETTAVLLALNEFEPVLVQHQIRALSIRSDNLVTVFNLQRQGASESLLKETKAIFSFLVRMDIRIMVTHVPGVENVEADALSRMDEVGDYELKQEVFDDAVSKLGVAPTVDMFANSRNTKCPLYLALPGPDEGEALALDCLRFAWSVGLPYVFPPVQIIPRVLQKIRLERITVLMVVPEWPSRPWWNLWQMGVQDQVVLGPSEQVLKAGPALARNQTKLPPGRFIMGKLFYNW
jgi:hypothetical protein